MGLNPSVVVSVRAIILLMVFVDKVKNLIRTFLGTEGNKYITTESGLKLQISDFAYTDKTKASGTWVDKPKSS